LCFNTSKKINRLLQQYLILKIQLGLIFLTCQIFKLIYKINNKAFQQIFNKFSKVFKKRRFDKKEVEIWGITFKEVGV
jgi:endonuclease IV